jgi:hypothetical protein
MKLIIREYLSALKEREELDAILPDLLSELGLNVFSRPGRGTRQDGVDVAAVGSLNGKADKVYLFSIKAGNLTRHTWDGSGLQALRPSLNEIFDAYIPNRLPNEHKTKDIIICLCFGGDIQEQVRPQVEGFINANKKPNIAFEEWNGDKLSALIQSSFLKEDLMPKYARSKLRKSLALLDEPDVSYQHFASLIRSLTNDDGKKEKDMVTAVRQINICLWILYAWCREAGNLESAYLSSELSLLLGWEITRKYIEKNTKNAKAIHSSYDSLLLVFEQISNQYLGEKIVPHTNKLHALSTAIQPSSDLDINLKLFDIIGRLAICGLWTYWNFLRLPDEMADHKKDAWNRIQIIMASIKQIISNNPILFLPIKDEQAIDINLSILFLGIDQNNNKDIISWLSEMTKRIEFSLSIKNKYPCINDSYSDLLDHPQNSESYFKKSTAGSILYPIIALTACLLEDERLYSEVQAIKSKHLQHCTFQLWYPDETSEERYYTFCNSHGSVLTNVCIERTPKEFQEQIFAECTHMKYCDELSPAKIGLWPLILLASRHYRLPVPPHYMKGLISPNSGDTADESNNNSNAPDEPVI